MAMFRQGNQEIFKSITGNGPSSSADQQLAVEKWRYFSLRPLSKHPWSVILDSLNPDGPVVGTEVGVAANQLMTYGPTLSPSCDRHNLFLSRANITEAIIERRRIGIPHRHSISAFHIGKSQQLNEENRSDTHKYINPRLSVGAKTSLGACEAVRTLLLMKSANLYIKISEKWVHLREHEGTEEVESNSTDEAQS